MKVVVTGRWPLCGARDVTSVVDQDLEQGGGGGQGFDLLALFSHLLFLLFYPK